MTTIYSIDGQQVTKRYRTAPRGHWVQDTPTTGHFVPADISAGYYPLIEVAQPSPDHTRSIVRQGDTFVEVWTFDQALADARTAEATEQTERDTVRNLFGALGEIVDGTTTLTAPQRDQLFARILRRMLKDQYGGN